MSSFCIAPVSGSKKRKRRRAGTSCYADAGVLCVCSSVPHTHTHTLFISLNTHCSTGVVQTALVIIQTRACKDIKEQRGRSRRANQSPPLLKVISFSEQEKRDLWCLGAAPGCDCVKLWEQTTWWYFLNRGAVAPWHPLSGPAANNF